MTPPPTPFSNSIRDFRPFVLLWLTYYSPAGNHRQKIFHLLNLRGCFSKFHREPEKGSLAAFTLQRFDPRTHDERALAE
jgi:hypothetical protein